LKLKNTKVGSESETKINYGIYLSFSSQNRKPPLYPWDLFSIFLNTKAALLTILGVKQGVKIFKIYNKRILGVLALKETSYHILEGKTYY
jgi:hypothetical protein